MGGSIVRRMDEAVSVGSAFAWVGDVGRQWGRWVRAHLGMTILLSALAFVFGWVWNTYVMAFGIDGFNPDPEVQTIATAEGRPFNSLFWLLFFSLLSGLITYGWQRGWRNLFGDLAVLPRRFGQAVSHNAGGAFAMLLWGVSVSLIISTLISSAVSLALGLVLLTLAATPIGTILNFVVIRLWRALTGIVAPTARMGPILLAGPFLVMIGEAAGLLLDWVFATWLIGLIVGVIAGVLSILLARGANPTHASAASVLIGLMVALSALWSGRAWGDDGGWQECATSDGQPCSEMGLGGIFAWFGSEGASTVLAHSAVGGVFAGIGTAIGVGVGSVAASVAVAGASAAAAGLTQPPSGPKATGHTGSHQGVPGQDAGGQHAGGQDAGGQDAAGQGVSGQHAAGHDAPGGPPHNVPTGWGGQHDIPTQAVPTEWGGQQGAPGQTGQDGAPTHGIPQQGGQDNVGPAGTDGPTELGSGWQTIGFDEPTIPQQPTISLDDVLPEPPERKRDREDGKDSGA